jgi:hypothetical protein
MFVSHLVRGLVAVTVTASLLGMGSVPADASSPPAAPALGAAKVAQVRITVPRSVLAHASASSGARVRFGATAVDSVSRPLHVTCNHVSGSLFRLGVTSVTCSAKNRQGYKASATFRVVVDVRGGRFAAPLVTGTVVQKGNPLPASFPVYAADGVTPVSYGFALALLSKRRMSVHVQRVGSTQALTQAVAYDRKTHRYSATLQTSAWVGGADYHVWYTVSAGDGSLLASRAVLVHVGIGA